MRRADNHSVDGPAGDLLDYLERECSRRCAELRERAERDAALLRREAWRHALVLKREAVRHERARRLDCLGRERIRIEAYLRQERFRRERVRLDRARSFLAGALAARWRDGPEARQAWIRVVFERASIFLPDGEWRVEHPDGWSAGEAEPLQKGLGRDRPEVGLTFAAGSHEAGLVIACGNASVDSRPEGLMARRDRVDALLTRALEIADPGYGAGEAGTGGGSS